MAEEYTQIQRQAPFIEERAEQLLETVFGPGGLSNVATTVPAYEVAPLTPEQQQAQQLAQQGLGTYAPALTAAQQAVQAGLGTIGAGVQTIAPGAITQYMDPYQQAVTQEALAELERQADIQSQKTAAEAVAAGAFGGSRFGVREAEEARALQDIKSRRIFEDLSRNFLQAQQAQQRSAQVLGGLGQQTLQAAQAQAGLGQLGQTLAGRDIDRLLGIGGIQQQQLQSELEAARQTELARQKEPFERTAFASDILRGVPSSQITYAQTPSPSTFQQIAGLGIAGLGALGGIGGGSISGGISALTGAFQ